MRKIVRNKKVFLVALVFLPIFTAWALNQELSTDKRGILDEFKPNETQENLLKVFKSAFKIESPLGAILPEKKRQEDIGKAREDAKKRCVAAEIPSHYLEIFEKQAIKDAQDEWQNGTDRRLRR